MVPTHAPDAAKASYSTMTERVIAPLPQAAAKKDPKLANNWKTKSAQELTDEEVKSMPDSEYMNEKQLAFFRHKLLVLLPAILIPAIVSPLAFLLQAPYYEASISVDRRHPRGGKGT